MNNNEIKSLSEKVNNFLNEESAVRTKINELEDKMQKMNHVYFNHSAINLDNLEASNDNLNEFLRKGNEPNLVTKSFSGEVNEGEVLIKPALHKKIISEMLARSPMRQLASVESISTRSLDIVIETGDFGAGWVSETGARNTTGTPQLNKKSIHAYELYAQPKATQSLINDAEINIENWLSGRLVDCFTKLENSAFINGDGVDKPSGLLTNADIATVNMGNAVTALNLLELINSLDEGYLANASFLMNRSTLSAIQSLQDNNGRFIWQQSLSESLKPTIFGIPVYVSSDMPNIDEDKLSIALGDFKSAYKIVDRSSINILRDPFTDKPYVRFYAVKRVGGDVINPSAVKFGKFTA